jgi:hypothetical protein
MARIALIFVVCAALLPVALFVVPYLLWGPPESDDGKDGFQPGALNQQAVADAVAFPDYPVAWLGEEFLGYRLTAFEHQSYALPPASTFIDNVILVYGACERGPRENSCTPPLALTIRRSGDPLPAGGVVQDAPLSPAACEGWSGEAGKTTVPWTQAGIVIDVQARGGAVRGGGRIAEAGEHGGVRRRLTPLDGFTSP